MQLPLVLLLQPPSYRQQHPSIVPHHHPPPTCPSTVQFHFNVLVYMVQLEELDHCLIPCES